MTFLYFAYGSNMWPPQIRSRCPSAQPIDVSRLAGWAPVYDKPSRDGSSKLNITESDSGVHGVIYEIADDERPALDAAEPGYEPIRVRLESDVEALTYRWAKRGSDVRPYDWYVSTVLAGANRHELPDRYVRAHLAVETDPDPIAPGFRPASSDDLRAMQEILSAALTSETPRYIAHSGDLAWWVFHDDPRYPDHLSYWLQDDHGLLVIDARNGEISAFARPGEDRVAIIDWAQRRLDGRGEVRWVSDDDHEMISVLESRGYKPVTMEHPFLWDLENKEIPEPRLPDGWVLRPLEGEHEADNRRRASHRAFKSTMPETVHLDRYLEFMRSPVYESSRDLVAVDPEGRIAAFVVWWPDSSSGVAQIEPFGTDPDFHRAGVGRALMYYVLRQMKEGGMRLCFVITWDRPDSVGFYEGVGFEPISKVRTWAMAPGSDDS